jgi:hypothetical protein
MGSDDFPSLHVVPLTHNLHLTKLKIDAVDYTDETVKLTDELSPASFAQLVSSFPNLIDVNVCINKPMVRTPARLDIDCANCPNRFSIVGYWFC